MKSVMGSRFSRIPKAEVQRSAFDRSHGRKQTFDSGYLVPFLTDLVVPGDSIRCNTTIQARLATPLVPFMDNLFLDTAYFFVPLRILYDSPDVADGSWVQMCGERKPDTDSSIDFVTPTMTAIVPVGQLQDYFAWPIEVQCTGASWWNRAYNDIWNYFYRDQNLQDEITVDRGPGPDLQSNYILRRRCKRPDYFTSALPFPQKGLSVTIPLGTTAPVYGDGNVLGLWDGTDTYGMYTGAAAGAPLHADTTLISDPVGTAYTPTDPTNDQIGVGVVTAATGEESGLFADLNGATAATINSLREAFQIQRMLERDARGGTRFKEVIEAHFNVTNPDFRINRPEYLGGGSQRMNIHPVQQQNRLTDTQAGDDYPIGSLAAYGDVVSTKNGFSKSFSEHGVILGLVNVRADLTYQQHFDKMYLYSDRYDYYWPALAHLGEQAIQNQEILFTGVDDTVTWGYQERWSEMRFKQSEICGQYRSDYAESLDIWHLSQDFGGVRPALDDAFIQDEPPLDRVLTIVISGELRAHQILFDSYSKYIHTRAMPTYSVPGMIDHL